MRFLMIPLVLGTPCAFSLDLPAADAPQEIAPSRFVRVKHKREQSILPDTDSMDKEAPKPSKAPKVEEVDANPKPRAWGSFYAPK